MKQYIIICLLIMGCTTQLDNALDEKIEVQDATEIDSFNETVEIDGKQADKNFKNIERSVNILFEDGYLIGQDHADDLNFQLDNLEGKGLDKEINDLRIKINTLLPKENIIASVKQRRQSSELPNDQEQNLLPNCEGLKFDTLPVDLDKIYEITPRGNLGPPGHTFPTDHSYLHLSAGGSTNTTIPLYAPANVHILSVASGKGFTDDPIDYTIYFALCKHVIGYYNHVKAISDELQKILDEVECEDFTVQHEGSCTKTVFAPIKGGTQLGQVGKLQGNFDFGLIDLRSELPYANPSRYGTRSRYIACPYDYFNGNLKEKFYDLIKRKGRNRCGTVMQDVPGSLKGNWFYNNSDAVENWNYLLAFVDDNDDPEVSVISIGGVILPPQKVEFTAVEQGLINLNFENVIPGEIYCYEFRDSERILVQMKNSTEILVEHQDINCADINNFNKPYLYQR